MVRISVSVSVYAHTYPTRVCRSLFDLAYRYPMYVSLSLVIGCVIQAVVPPCFAVQGPLFLVLGHGEEP